MGWSTGKIFHSVQWASEWLYYIEAYIEDYGDFSYVPNQEIELKISEIPQPKTFLITVGLSTK